MMRIRQILLSVALVPAAVALGWRIGGAAREAATPIALALSVCGGTGPLFLSACGGKVEHAPEVRPMFGQSCEAQAVCSPVHVNGTDAHVSCWPWHTEAERTRDLYHTCVIYCSVHEVTNSGATCLELTGHGCTTDRAGWSICEP
jgi:hypothetical protein